MENQSNIKRVTFDIPADLYNRFSASNLRRECATDSECIRAAIKSVLDQEQDCKGKTT